MCSSDLTIHHHEIIAADAMAQRPGQLRAALQQLGRGVAHVAGRTVRNYSATDEHVAFDITLAP